MEQLNTLVVLTLMQLVCVDVDSFPISSIVFIAEGN